LYFTRQRPDMPVRRELRLLAATLFGYGTLQLMPSAGPAAAVRVIAAAALLMAGVQLWRSHPKVLVLRSPVELEDARRQLERQIAERKAAEEKLVRAAAFPNENPHPFFEMDTAGRVTYLNPEAQIQFPDLLQRGLEHQVLAGCADIFRSFQRGERESLTREVEASGTVYQQKICYLMRRNTVLIYLVDVTGLKGAQEAVRQNEERYRRLFEEAPVAYHEIDGNGVIRRVNAAGLALLGLKLGQLLGKPAWEL